MLRALLASVVRGRLQAITFATAFTLIPYLSGAVVSLVSLRHGMREGLFVATGATLLFGVFAYVVFDAAWLGLVMLLMTWAPSWVLAGVLRSSGSQGNALMVAGLLGVLMLGAFHFAVGDPTAWWQERMHAFFAWHLSALEQAPGPGDLERLGANVEFLAPMMTGSLVAGIVSGAVIMMLMGRWWQAVLDNPRGFGREFRAMRIDRRFGASVLVVSAVALVSGSGPGSIGIEILRVAMILYVFQGLSLVHGVVVARGASRGWLIAVYVLLIGWSQNIVPLLAVAGLLDTWVNLRGKAGASGG